MKIANSGLDLPQGKVRYNDRIFADLAEKFQPEKTSPYYVEFLLDNFEAASAIAIAHSNLLDLLILDMEKIENRLTKAGDESEITALEKCLTHLEGEKPVCDLSMSGGEQAIVDAFGLLSSKPTAVFEDASLDTDGVSHAIMEKAQKMFFYTVGKQEVHAWLVNKGVDAVTCAAEIHSDLARGFIKAELVSCKDMLAVHNLQDARSKTLTKLVDRDYVIPENTILDIRFNV